MSLCFPEKKQKQVKEKKENNNKITYFYSFVNRVKYTGIKAQRSILYGI